MVIYSIFIFPLFLAISFLFCSCRPGLQTWWITFDWPKPMKIIHFILLIIGLGEGMWYSSGQWDVRGVMFLGSGSVCLLNKKALRVERPFAPHLSPSLWGHDYFDLQQPFSTIRKKKIRNMLRIAVQQKSESHRSFMTSLEWATNPGIYTAKLSFMLNH